MEFQLQHQSFQWTPRTDLLQDGLVGSPCSPRDSQESSPTPQFKSINFSVLSFLHSQIKRHLITGRKVMTNLDSILKSRDITLPTKVCLVQAMDFPVVTYGCENWSIKKAEHRRIDAFELWCWRRLLRVPWTARRSSQSILKEISPESIGRTDAEADTAVLWPPDV